MTDKQRTAKLAYALHVALSKRVGDGALGNLKALSEEPYRLGMSGRELWLMGLVDANEPMHDPEYSVNALGLMVLNPPLTSETTWHWLPNRTSRSGRCLWQCQICGHESVTPDKLCGGCGFKEMNT